MSRIDYSSFALPKPTPRVLTRKAKQRADKRAWRTCARKVDQRDAVDEAPECFITGRRLQTWMLDEWTYRDRAHLNARSTNKPLRYFSSTVISVSRGVHALIDSSALLLLNKRGEPARTVGTIDHVMWNRRLVAKGLEPCKIRTGLTIREMVD